MKTEIYCKSAAKGIHSFYLLVGGNEYFLFNQAYRKGVDEYYSRGVYIDNAIKHSRAHRDVAISRTMNKLPVYIGYVEKEYGIAVLNKTKKRCADNYNKERCA